MTRIAASLVCVIAFGCRPSEPKPVPQSSDLTPGASSSSAVRLESLPDTYPTALMAQLHGAETFVTTTFRRVEGNVHDTEAQRDYDQARAGFLEAAGYRVIRVRNRDVSREHLDRVLRQALGTNR